jgi:hypothetical protein
MGNESSREVRGEKRETMNRQQKFRPSPHSGSSDGLIIGGIYMDRL